MQNEIITKLKEYNIDLDIDLDTDFDQHFKICDESSLIKIHDLFLNDKLFDSNNDIEYFYISLYLYNFRKKNDPNLFTSFTNYCSSTIKDGNVYIEKYLLMAIERNNTDAMYILGSHYLNYNHGIEKGELYLSMACEKNHYCAFKYLRKYFSAKKSYTELLNLYTKCSDIIGNEDLIFLIDKLYFEDLSDLESLALTNLMLKIDLDLVQIRQAACRDVHIILRETLPIMIISHIKLLKSNMDLLDLHFRYSMNGLGYEDAKKDFMNNIHNLDQNKFKISSK